VYSLFETNQLITGGTDDKIIFLLFWKTDNENIVELKFIRIATVVSFMKDR
jgi:hypothetical protein